MPVAQQTRSMQRKIRVLNGARAILEIIRNQPFRCVFVGKMPIHLNGGNVPLGLDLMLIPQPLAYHNFPPNITNLLCQYQSTSFKFCLDRNQLKYVDLSGKIPAGKQNWCEVRITLTQPCQFNVDDIVEIYGIPTVRILVAFIDTLQDLLDRYNSLQTCSHQPWLTKSQIKNITTVTEPLLRGPVIPRDLDQACAALSVSKQLMAIISGLPTSTKFQRLSGCLQRISHQVENWVNSHRDDRSFSPVTRDADEGSGPSGAVGENRDESDDWVEVTISTGVVDIHRSTTIYPCGEQVDDVFDFELLSMD